MQWFETVPFKALFGKMFPRCDVIRAARIHGCQLYFFHKIDYIIWLFLSKYMLFIILFMKNSISAAQAHRGTAFMSMFQCCFLWDSDKVYQNLIFDTFVINDPHQFFNTSKVNTQNIVFCIKCFFLATSFTRFSAISFCFLAVISKPNVQFR